MFRDFWNQELTSERIGDFFRGLFYTILIVGPIVFIVWALNEAQKKDVEEKAKEREQIRLQNRRSDNQVIINDYPEKQRIVVAPVVCNFEEVICRYEYPGIKSDYI